MVESERHSVFGKRKVKEHRDFECEYTSSDLQSGMSFGTDKFYSLLSV